jgi:ferritin-like protein
MQNYHEPPSELSTQTRDFLRALVTLKEEIEAIDWYQQRLTVTSDQHLKKILIHNKLEEMEHACMALEWLRRNMDGWDKIMRQYLFTKKDIVKIEGHE